VWRWRWCSNNGVTAEDVTCNGDVVRQASWAGCKEMLNVMQSERAQVQNAAVGIPSLEGKRVLILGLARQGLALARYCTNAGALVTISDLAAADRLDAELVSLNGLVGAGRIQLALGGHPLSLLDGCDLLCLSGGVPPQSAIVQEAVRRAIPLSNDSLMTFQIARARGLGPLIGITGSSGKTTTTTLVGRILAQGATRPVHVGGNIGAPLLDKLETIAPGEPIVLELSSFQLELFDPALAWGPVGNVGPDIAALLNITPNHLDRHPSMAAYADAKLNLLRSLPSGSTVILSADDPATARLAQAAGLTTGAIDETPAEWALTPLLDAMGTQMRNAGLRVQTFSRTHRLEQGAWLEEDALVYNRHVFSHRSEVQLRGPHNLSNLLAAAATSGAAGATLAQMGHVATHFEGVRHRLEVVREHWGVTWINDSIATSPERAVAALRSFDGAEQTVILLAGGKDKKLPWDIFAEEVVARVGFLIGFGEAGPMIVDIVRHHAEGRPEIALGTALVHQLDEAVELAARSAKPGTVVLLSPGGTSYDAYKDFEARGAHFVALVEQYSNLALRNGDAGKDSDQVQGEELNEGNQAD
jgi:UDP-N-acetylmuramoylalanine--D-glutamate ligase